MSLQYLADFESTVDPEDDDEVLTTHWIDQGLVLGGTLNGHLRAWHGVSGRAIGTAKERVHGIGIHAISSSLHNQTVLTAALDGTVALWDASEVPEQIASISTESDAEREAMQLDGQEHQQQTGGWPLRLIAAMTLGSGGKDDRNVESGSNAVPRQTIKDGKGPIAALLHPSEPYFATTGLDATTFLYSCQVEGDEASCRRLEMLTPTMPTQDGKKVGKAKLRDCGLSLAFNEAGTILAVGTQLGRVHLYEVQKAHLLETIRSQAKPVRALHFMPGGELFVGSDDGMVSVYDVRLDGLDLGAGFGDEFDEFAEDFSQSQQSQYTTSQSSASSLFSQTGPARTRSVAPFVRSWSTNSPYITGLKASPDGRIVATSSIDGHVRIWDFKSYPPAALCSLTQEKEVWSISWKPVASSTSRAQAMNGMMTAATQSAQAASAFVTGGADGRVRWYRSAGGSAV